MFILFVPYLICIYIFNVIWKLNNQLLIDTISAIKNIIFLKRKQITCSF